MSNRPSRPSRPSRLSRLSILPILLAGCIDQVAPDDPDGFAQTEAELAGGTLVGSPAQVGMIQLLRNGGFMCSGTMIAPDWALTAAHCNAQLASDTVRLGNANDATAQTSTIDRVVNNPAMDLELVHLSRSFDVAGRGLFYKLSLFADPSQTLLGKTARFYGSSADPTCTGASCGYGYLRSASVSINKLGSHNLGGASSATTIGGDSGGGLLYETAAGRELAGVLKCGLSDCLVRPEAFRAWALGVVYDRALDLPDIWNFDSQARHFFAVPLEDNYDATMTWNVCPDGAPWTYTLNYDTEGGYDWVHVSSAQPIRSYSGVGIVNGTGAGALTLRVQTDKSNRSRGITGFSVRCNSGRRFPNPWGVPSPAGTNDARTWDACPGGSPYHWTADYAYGPGGSGLIGTTVLSGTGTRSGTAAGELVVASATPAGGTDGLRRLTAQCDLGIQCHGNTCFTSTTGTTDARFSTVSWNPCNGGGFRYHAAYEFSPSYEFLRVRGGTTNEYQQFVGTGSSAWRAAGGAVTVEVATSGNPSHGVRELVAQCDAWGADRTSTVHVLSGTYGRNCRINRDNATQKLVEACRAQGGSSCSYGVSTATLGDPAYGCAKDFTAEWTCGTSAVVKRTVVAGEANGHAAVLSCP